MKSETHNRSRLTGSQHASARERRQSQVTASKSETTAVTFLLLNNFSLISYASAVEPLRLANKALKRTQYEYKNVSLDGHPVTASNGTTVTCGESLRDVSSIDLLIVCSSDDVERIKFPKWLGHKLRNLERHGCQLGGICTGAYVLAKLGFLEKCVCTIHWEYEGIFSETFPRIPLTQNLVELSGRRFTCAGGTAPLDLMLQFIRDRHGEGLAGTIADLAIHHGQREGERHQRLSIRERLGVYDPTLLQAIDVMEKHIESPLPLAEVSAHVGVSVRQLQRAFRSHGLPPPRQYYLHIRLERARELLRRTSMAISEIVYACGFVSPSHFSKCYRVHFGMSPHQDRLLSEPLVSSTASK